MFYFLFKTDKCALISYWLKERKNNLELCSDGSGESEITTAVSNAYADECNKWTLNSDEAESADVVTFDGSIMEGGGQIVWNTTALSAILQKPISFVNVTANRDLWLSCFWADLSMH